MKAEEAILKLTTRPNLDHQVLDSPFFKFYRRIDMETCNEIAVLIEQQQAEIEILKEQLCPEIYCSACQLYEERHEYERAKRDSLTN